MIDSSANVCPMQQECARDNVARWEIQEQRYIAQAELNKRMGAWKDKTQGEMGKCKAAIAKSMDNTLQLKNFIVAVQRQNKEFMEASTGVMKELSSNMVALKESLETRHDILFERVALNASRADRAVDNAEVAAKTAEEARNAAEQSTGKINTMAKIVFSAWGMTLIAVSSTITVLVGHYWWPALWAWLDHMFGKVP